MTVNQSINEWINKSINYHAINRSMICLDRKNHTSNQKYKILKNTKITAMFYVTGASFQEILKCFI